MTTVLLADLLLLLHFGIVLYVVLLPPLVWLGAARGWRWPRSFPLRLLHLATILFVVAQSWLGQTCPLTVWENDLRRAAGASTYQSSFIEDWVGRLLFVQAPAWAFVLAYSAFAALVLWTWWRWPPRRRYDPAPEQRGRQRA